MRAVFHNAAVAILGRRVLLPPSRRVVLLYHDISPESAPHNSPDYSTDPSTFARHLDLIQTELEVVPLDDLLKDDALPGDRPCAALTFDDGFRSVKEVAMPILADRRLSFTVFVNGRAVREDRLEYLPQYQAAHDVDRRVYLDAEEVAAIAREGVQIGSHATSHRPLVGLSDPELDAEIIGNKEYLEAVSGTTVRHFALPYGKKRHYDTRSLQRCFDAGHDHVFSTNPRSFRRGEVAKYSRVPVPRIGLTNESSSEIRFLLNRPLVRRIDL